MRPLPPKLMSREKHAQDRKDDDAGVYHRGVDSVTGFVLAGGKSSRMGQDKAFLQLGRAHSAGACAGSGTGPRQEAYGSSAAPKNSRPSVRLWKIFIRDRDPWLEFMRHWPGTRTELNLIIAVDMPFLQPDFLSYLVAQARQTAAVVVVPGAGGRLQPLCAIYRRLRGSGGTISARRKKQDRPLVLRSRDPRDRARRTGSETASPKRCSAT